MLLFLMGVGIIRAALPSVTLADINGNNVSVAESDIQADLVIMVQAVPEMMGEFFEIFVNSKLNWFP